MGRAGKMTHWWRDGREGTQLTIGEERFWERARDKIEELILYCVHLWEPKKNKVVGVRKVLSLKWKYRGRARAFEDISL